MNLYDKKPVTLPIFETFGNYVFFIILIWAITYYFRRDVQYSAILAYNIITPIILFLLHSSICIISLYTLPANTHLPDKDMIALGCAALYLFYWPQHISGFLLGIFCLWFHKESLNKKYKIEFVATLLIILLGLFWSHGITTVKF